MFFRFSGPLKPSWDRLGGVLEALGGALDASWRRLGSVLEALGSVSGAQRQFPSRGSCFQRAQRCAEACAEAVALTGVMFPACAEVRRDVRRGSFLDRGRVFSVRRGAQRRAQRHFPRQGSRFQRAQKCAETCADAVSSTGVVFSACAELRSDVRRGSFLDRGHVFRLRKGAQ